MIEDFNGDGKARPRGGQSAGDGVSFFLGNGDGTFEPEFLVSTGDHPVSVASGDFDSDGHVDLAISNYGEVGQADSVSVLLDRPVTADAPIPLILPHSQTPTVRRW